MTPDDLALLHRHLNGDLDPTEQDALFQRLEHNPELRQALSRLALDETLTAEIVREDAARQASPARKARRLSLPALAAAGLLLAALAFLLNSPAGPPGPLLLVRNPALDQAVARGVTFLRSRAGDLLRPLRDGARHNPAEPRSYAELGLLALLETGLTPLHDDLARSLYDHVLATPPTTTYTAALQAIVLARLDPVGHQDRLRHCAQMLVDLQALNGQWDYGHPVDPPAPGLTRITARRPGPPSGDNSCSSYAAYGLRACLDAGIPIDPDVLVRARAWWLRTQCPDGGWGYNDSGGLALETSPDSDKTSNAPYGSMTASGIAALRALGDHDNPALQRSFQWLREHPAADRNPGKDPGFAPLHHFLALRRAGLPLSAPALQHLLASQQSSGAWQLEDGTFMARENRAVLDTCLALILLQELPR